MYSMPVLSYTGLQWQGWKEKLLEENNYLKKKNK